MKYQTFLYQKSTVYDACLKALKRRDFFVLSADPRTGSIHAITGDGYLSHKVEMSISIGEITSDTSCVHLNLQLIKKSFLKPFHENQSEEKFMDTLYNCITFGAVQFKEFCQRSMKAA